MDNKKLIKEYLEILTGFYRYKTIEDFIMGKPEIAKSFIKILKDKNLNDSEKTKMINVYFITVRDAVLYNF